MSISGLTNLLTNPNPKSLNPPSIPTTKGTQSNGNCGGGPRVKMVLSSTRGCEVEEEMRNLGGPNLIVYSRFSAPVKPNSSPSTTSSPANRSKEDEERQNYFVNMGYAIRCLREEFPELFYKELSFDIYREDIVFKDPVNTFVGIDNYKSMFWALRFHGRMFFKALWIDIISVWQPMEKVILVRWTVHGIPRVPWDSHGRFDGISEYKLDKNGKIYEHKVDNIARNTLRKFRVLSVRELLQSVGCPSTAKPTCYEIALPSILNLVPFMVALAWLLQYLNSHSAHSQRS